MIKERVIPVIKVKNLYYTYPGNSEPTIKGLNFSVKKGEIFGFLGPSGAGKSTTQKIINGILKKFTGQVQIMSIDVSKIKSDFYENIGVSFEFPNLYHRFTARENLEFFASLYQKECEDYKTLLKMVGLVKYANTRVSDFSKGMKMRLNLCRAFLNKPNLLFLDEPTSGLDPVNISRVKDIILKQQREGRTIFLTTHDMQTSEDLCDRVAFIVNGKIDIIDSPLKLKKQFGKMKVEVGYKDNKNINKEVFNLSGLGNNKKFLQLLKNKEIETIHSQEASLDDVFIEVTGRSLQ